MLAAAGIHPTGRSAQEQHDFFAAPAHGEPATIAQRRFGDLCFYGANQHDIHHVTIAWTEGKVLEAGRGGRSTKTEEDALRAGAKVMISDLNRHGHLLDVLRPRGLSWNAVAQRLDLRVGGAVAAAGTAGANLAALVDHSPLRHYDWPHRGLAPRAYQLGMLEAFLRANRIIDGTEQGQASPAIRRALEIATAAEIGKPSRDVLAWYSQEIADAGASMTSPGERLVAIFAVIVGLGMRESSGRYCVGADTPESGGEPTTPENAEAGLFQVSWDSMDANADRRALFTAMKDGTDLLDVFNTNVGCHGDDLVIHGAGEQAQFQTAMKQNSLFACLYTAMFMRQPRSHWGPINTRKVEVRKDAVDLLRAALASA